MGQGMIGGATPYNHQSLEDIQSDINNWQGYSKIIQVQFENFIKQNEQRFNNLEYELKQLFAETLQTTKTFISDFEIIKDSIQSGNITDKEIDLLKNIGNISIENNSRYGKTWHGSNINSKKNTDIYSKLYCDGRNYFVDLQDASNAAVRLENYKNSKSTQIINNTYNATGTYVQQGSNNNLTVNNYKDEDLEKLNELTEKLLNNIENYFEKDEEKNEVKELLETIKEEANKEKPKKYTIKSILNNLQRMNSNSADFLSSINAIAQMLGFQN